MAEIKILVNGYARTIKGIEEASPNTVLIKDKGKLVLVDPGSNSKLLLSALAKEGLSPSDIKTIFLTHYHLDHLLNIRLFPKADILDGDTINRGDKIISYSGNIPTTKIKIIPTPGHAFEHCSLLVDTKEGRVAIAGDVWWWTDQEQQKTDKKSLLFKKDPFVKNKKALLKSRKKILSLADYIIPGHGKMFKVEK